jgi:hypothetical protein
MCHEQPLERSTAFCELTEMIVRRKKAPRHVLARYGASEIRRSTTKMIVI